MTRQSSDVLCCMEAIAQHSECGLEFPGHLGYCFGQSLPVLQGVFTV